MATKDFPKVKIVEINYRKSFVKLSEPTTTHHMMVEGVALKG